MKSNRVRDYDDDSDPLARLRDERNQLRIALGTYGRHAVDCSAIATGQCNCGWSDVAKRWGIRSPRRSKP